MKQLVNSHRPRHQDGNHLPSMPSVNIKVCSHGHQLARIVQLRQPNETGVGERHGDILVFLHQILQRSDMALHAQRNGNDFAPDHLEDGLPAFGQIARKMTGFCQHGFTGQQRRFNFRGLSFRPLVKTITAIDAGDERSRVENDAPFHFPRSFRCSLLNEKSAGPLTEPTRSLARSRHEPLGVPDA